MQAGMEGEREGGVPNMNESDSTFDYFILSNKIICFV